ncbi:heterokaryon incompatibility protein-domain-containing protein [Hypoxylon sp. FL1284]|nr:heterokaryon incompatibility protein-domain-containing protein [Hypoxylon sp. FL1284]
MDTYKYRPLDLERDEIRLAVVHPGSFNEDIHVSFQHVHLPVPESFPQQPDGNRIHNLEKLRNSLPPGWHVAPRLEDDRLLFWKENFSSWNHPDPLFPYDAQTESPKSRGQPDRPSFEALSYCWGEPDPAETILVDYADASSSGSCLAKLTIRPNLAAALRHLRNPTSPRTLWIDAICINQEDTVETSRHVARMGSIYALATRVVAWLGPATLTSSIALDELVLLGQQIELVTGTGPGSESAVLGSRLCGTKTVLWRFVRRGIRILRETMLPRAGMRTGLLPGPVNWLPHMLWTQGLGEWESFSKLLGSTGRTKCSDPKDRIYALLGLIDRNLASRITPNYKNSVVKVYQHAFWEFVQLNRNLMLLKFCDAGQRKDSWDGPSWVPDWEHGVIVAPQYVYAAGGTKAEATLVDAEQGILSCTGIEAAKVRATSEKNWVSYDPHLSLATSLEIVKAWYGLWEKHRSTLSEDVEFFTAIRYGWVWERRRCGRTAREYSDEYRALVAHGDTTTGTVKEGGYLLQDLLRDEIHGTVFCTDQGLPGMGPVGMKPGDIVVVLLGCAHPLVLRASSQAHKYRGNQTYEVVGPAYVHGLMEAQALLGPTKQPWTVLVDDKTGCQLWRCYNEENGTCAPEDVRLGPLPLGWSALEDGKFRSETGEFTDEDPRETGKHLRNHGAKLKTFYLS